MNYRRLAQIEYRRAAAYEKKYARRIRAALKDQGEHFIATGELSNAMLPVIEEMHEEILRDFLSRQYEQLERDTVTVKRRKTGELMHKRERFFNPAWNRWIKDYTMTELLTKVTAIDDTTREMLRAVTAEGASTGATFSQTASAITERTAGRIAQRRARMISRTEVGEAINAAKTKSSDDWAKETGMEQGKLWIHRGAADPRDWHSALDTGIPIKKNETWTVTNPNTGETDYMQYPHDPGASAGNVVNCSCQVIYTRWEG